MKVRLGLNSPLKSQPRRRKTDSPGEANEKLIFMTLFIPSGLTVNAQKVKVEFNKTVDLSKYKTYVWLGGLPAKNPIINQQIVATLERALAAKGLTKVNADGDLHVVYWAASDFGLHVSYADWGWTPGRAGMPISQSWPVPKGTLQVNILEGSSRDILWRATATETLNHSPSGDMVKDAKDVEKLVNRSVEKMFKKFPRTL